MVTRISHVFFDSTDTLLCVRGSVGEVYATLAQRHGVDLAAPVLQAAFDAAVRSVPQPVQPGLPPRDIAQRERQWWAEVVTQTVGGRDRFTDFDAFFDELFERFRDATAWELVPNVRPTLQRLQESGITLGIISDMDSRLFDLLQGFDLAHAFSGIYLSYSTGYCKPDRRLFEAACRDSGTTVEQSLHVGDSWNKDVLGARNSGMTAVWYRPQGASDAQQPCVTDLLQLPELIEREGL